MRTAEVPRCNYWWVPGMQQMSTSQPIPQCESQSQIGAQERGPSTPPIECWYLPPVNHRVTQHRLDVSCIATKVEYVALALLINNERRKIARLYYFKAGPYRK